MADQKITIHCKVEGLADLEKARDILESTGNLTTSLSSLSSAMGNFSAATAQGGVSAEAFAGFQTQVEVAIKNVTTALNETVSGLSTLAQGQQAAVDATNDMGAAARETTAAVHGVTTAVTANTSAQENQTAAIGENVAATKEIPSAIREANAALIAQTKALAEADAAEEAEAKQKRQTIQSITDLQQSMTLLRRGYQQLTAAVAIFAPAMQEATRLIDISEATGKSVREIVILEAAMRAAGVTSAEAFAQLSESTKNLAFAEAERSSGTLATTLAANAASLTNLRRAFDEVSAAVQGGLSQALSAIAPMLQTAAKILSAIPAKAMAIAILALAASMAGPAVLSIAKVTTSLAAQTRVWLANTTAIRANTTALAANAATAAQGTRGTVAAGMRGSRMAGGGLAIAGIGLSIAADGVGQDAGASESARAAGFAGRTLGSSATGAGVGAMVGGVPGAAIGAGLGWGIGFGNEIADSMEAAEASKYFSLKARAAEEEKSLAALKAAAEQAQPAIESLSRAMNEWGQDKETSLSARAGQVTNELDTLSRVLNAAASTPESIRSAIGTQTGYQQNRLASQDPATARDAAMQLGVLAQYADQVDALAAQKEQIDKEQKDRDHALFLAKLADERSFFLTAKRTAEELEQFDADQLDKRHTYERANETADEREQNDPKRQFEFNLQARAATAAAAEGRREKLALLQEAQLEQFLQTPRSKTEIAAQKIDQLDERRAVESEYESTDERAKNDIAAATERLRLAREAQEPLALLSSPTAPMTDSVTALGGSLGVGEAYSAVNASFDIVARASEQQVKLLQSANDHLSRLLQNLSISRELN